MATTKRKNPKHEAVLDEPRTRPCRLDDAEALASAREKMRKLLETTDFADRVAEAFDRETLKTEGLLVPPSSRRSFEPLKKR